MIPDSNFCARFDGGNSNLDECFSTIRWWLQPLSDWPMTCQVISRNERKIFKQGLWWIRHLSKIITWRIKPFNNSAPLRTKAQTAKSRSSSRLDQVSESTCRHINLDWMTPILRRPVSPELYLPLHIFLHVAKSIPNRAENTSSLPKTPYTVWENYHPPEQQGKVSLPIAAYVWQVRNIRKPPPTMYID